VFIAIRVIGASSSFALSSVLHLLSSKCPSCDTNNDSTNQIWHRDLAIIVDSLIVECYHITKITEYISIIIIIIIIIIQTFVRHTLSASELNLRRRQLLGGEDG